MTSSVAKEGFRDFVRAAGWEFLPITLISKFSLPMTLVGVLTFITSTSGSLAEAGAVSGLLGLVSGLTAPVLGAASDRFGQRRVLVPIIVINASSLVAIAVCGASGAALPVLLVLAAVAGASSPQIGPMARSRWLFIARRSTRAPDTAMGYESMTDELSFVFGPVFVALIATAFGGGVPLVVAAAIIITFGLWFSLHRTALRGSGRMIAEPPIDTPSSAAIVRTVAVYVAGTTVMGFFWGIALTSLTELAAGEGNPALSGLVYGCMGITAALSAVIAGSLHTRFTATQRWLFGSVVLVVASTPLLLATSTAIAAVCFCLIGIGVGPIISSLFALGGAATTPKTASAVMSSLNGGIILGQAAGTILGGIVASERGFASGFFVLLATAAVMLVIAAAHRRGRNAA